MFATESAGEVLEAAAAAKSEGDQGQPLTVSRLIRDVFGSRVTVRVEEDHQARDNKHKKKIQNGHREADKGHKNNQVNGGDPSMSIEQTLENMGLGVNGGGAGAGVSADHPQSQSSSSSSNSVAKRSGGKWYDGCVFACPQCGVKFHRIK